MQALPARRCHCDCTCTHTHILQYARHWTGSWACRRHKHTTCFQTRLCCRPLAAELLRWCVLHCHCAWWLICQPWPPLHGQHNRHSLHATLNYNTAIHSPSLHVSTSLIMPSLRPLGAAVRLRWRWSTHLSSATAMTASNRSITLHRQAFTVSSSTRPVQRSCAKRCTDRFMPSVLLSSCSTRRSAVATPVRWRSAKRRWSENGSMHGSERPCAD